MVKIGINLLHGKALQTAITFTWKGNKKIYVKTEGTENHQILVKTASYNASHYNELNDIWRRLHITNNNDDDCDWKWVYNITANPTEDKLDTSCLGVSQCATICAKTKVLSCEMLVPHRFQTTFSQSYYWALVIIRLLDRESVASMSGRPCRWGMGLILLL